MTDVAALLTDEVLVEEFGDDTVRRARSYVVDGSLSHVQLLKSGPGELRALAHVTGSRGRRYSVVLTASVDAGWDDDVLIWTQCSCPMHMSCKHGAALAMHLAGGAREQARTSWERHLTAVVDELAPRESTALRPKALAIRVELRPAVRRQWGSTSAGIHLRLLNQGARDNWIKTGISWSGIPSAVTLGTHRPDHLAGLRGLHSGLVSEQRYYHSSIEEPALVAFGPWVVDHLREAIDAGVHLELGAGLSSFVVVNKAVGVVADVVAGADGGRLTLAVVHEDERWAGDRVLTVGQPAHSVVLLGGEESAVDAVLAPLERPLPARSAGMLTASEPLLLPDDARDRWGGVLLPRLGRALPVGSSDDSVAIEPLPRPRLRVTVTWRSAVDAELVWDWVYGKGRGRVACLLGSVDDLGGRRDLAAESAILADVRWPHPPRPTERFTGSETLVLANRLLPDLRDDGVVEVVETDRPTFREAEGDLEISFEATATDDTVDGPVDWLDLWVSIRVDDEQVPLPEVLASLTLGHDHIVLPSGLVVPTDRPELAALDELVRAAAELRERNGDRIGVGKHDLGVWAQLAELGVVDEQAEEWVRRARALADLETLPAPEPTGLTSTLRPYQLQGFHWLAFLWETGLGGILADDMGLGKTLQVLALVSHARAQGAGPFLVIAPTSVVSAWQTEAAAHAPDLRVRAVTGSARRRGVSVADLSAEADIVVTTYTLLRLEQDDYAEVAWSGLVLDEAQQVKNHQGKTYRAARMVEAPFKLAVTGTPFENRLMELWSLLSITTPGLYPSPKHFTQHVVSPVERQGDQSALRRLRGRIRPFVLRRTKELVAKDLPPKQEQVIEVQLSPKHRRAYDTHLQRERQKLLGLLEDFEANRVAIFSALTTLRQLALDPGLVDDDHSATGSAKLDLLVEQLREVTAEGHRALVFSQFTRYLTKVRERLTDEGISTVYLDGRTRRRGEVVESFRSGQADVFLISLKAGGVGLTLTEADYVYVLDPWWNPAVEAQAVDRAHRIGQERPVMVYRLVSAQTIEEKVMALKARKAELFANVIDGDGLLSTAIGADDVRALITD